MKRTGIMMVVVLGGAWLNLGLSGQEIKGKPVPIMAKKEWTGSVADASLGLKEEKVIAGKAGLEYLWKKWMLEGSPPQVNFEKDLIVAVTTRGSRLRLVLQKGDNGDLKALGLATRDLGPGFRYTLALVDREGIKTVNGRELPKE